MQASCPEPHPILTHEAWARLCFEHIVAEKRAKPPLLCSLDDLLPLHLLDPERIEAAVVETLAVGRTFKFVAYGMKGQGRTIDLRAEVGPYSYFTIGDASYWRDTDEYRGRWAFLRPFVAALPFESVGRALLMFSTREGRGVLHFDHDQPGIQHEFVWLKPTNRKRFLLRYGSQNHYVTSRSCWFDSRHIHQTEEGADLEVSMRVDGVFTPAFRQRVVERCAPILQLPGVPVVLPPVLSLEHERRTPWMRMRNPRHYSHYFATIARQFARSYLRRAVKT